MLEIRKLNKSFGTTKVLEDVDIFIPDGEIYGFVGSNGAGKTTCLKILAGILERDSGEMLWNGVDIWKDKSFKKIIGYMPDVAGKANGLKVWEYLDFFASCYGMTGLTSRNRITQLLEELNLETRADSYVESLSLGMRQRLSLARAVIHDPELLILDEPSSGLDPRTRTMVSKFIHRQQDAGKTIIMCSHILSELSENCSGIGIIDEGRMLYSGGMDEMQDLMTGNNPIRIKVAEEEAAAMHLLRESPLVETLTVSGREFRIQLKGGAMEQVALLRQLMDANVPVIGMYREESSLKSVFMQMTDHSEEKAVLTVDYNEESGL